MPLLPIVPAAITYNVAINVCLREGHGMAINGREQRRDVAIIASS